MKPLKKISLLIIFCFASLTCLAQSSRSNELILESITDEIPQLESKVSFSMTNIELYEFLRTLGKSNGLNLDIDPNIKNKIAINFKDVSIKDLLVYLCDQYQLQLAITGNIIFISKTPTPPPPVVEIVPKNPNITFNQTNKELSYDLQNDTLRNVIKKIAELSSYNIITSASNDKKLVNGFVKDMAISNAIIELAQINDLKYEIKDSTTFYYYEKLNDNNNQTFSMAPRGITIETNGIDSIYHIVAANAKIQDILNIVSKKLDFKYYVFSEISGTTDIKVSNIDISSFLDILFNSTDFTYKNANDVFLIGNKESDDIRTAEIFKMRYRTVTEIEKKIPASLKNSIEIIALEELNSVIVAGNKPKVKEVLNFLMQIDKTVPVINIELIILDVRRSFDVATGIMAGIDKDNTNSSYASVFPNLDVSLNANVINDIIDGINGTGIINLGNVTPGFYINLKASENNGVLKIKSTPKLSTMNGKEATMSIGETRYYIEQTTNVITTQSTTTVTGINYKELQANFAITIKPIVSGDEQITLDINVEQSTFTEQTSKDGPYGRLTRNFQSSIRARNNDMIILGGLQEKSNSNAGTGMPILSRIPVIKWLFSSRSQSTKNTKLVILIHPTVFY